ncbi:hypothetical protein EBQ26_11755 [Allofranklinella schreckenbergeri]|uniref:Uncharacterized protein n=1 Tax=Allofranklinella schreckenbergeri TaxID=1076744 RepID=A0A3M6PW34_9BURK|nr:hypothetical protein EBQ26_11755 [Allofranklinella schreckenbergeri]
MASLAQGFPRFGGETRGEKGSRLRIAVERPAVCFRLVLLPSNAPDMRHGISASLLFQHP